MSPAPREGFDPEELPPWETDEDAWPDMPAAIETRIDPLPIFPHDVLPRLMRRWVGEQAKALEVPIGLAGLTALGVLAAATAGQLRVQISDGWIVPTNLYVAPVASSGERKSPLLTAATRGLREALDELQARYDRRAPDIAKAGVYRASAKQRRADAAKAEDRQLADELITESLTLDSLADEMHPGPPPRLWSGDTTAEALEDRLGEQRGRFAVLSDEGGALTSLGRYTKGDANLDALLKGWDGGELVVDRRGRQVRVRHAYVSVLLMLQPWQLGILAQHEYAARGMAARFLYDWSPSRVGTRHLTGGVVPFDVSTQWSDLVRDLTVECFEAVTPTTLELSPGGHEHLRVFVEDPVRGVERRMLPEGDLHDMQAWTNKLPGQVARISGLLHVAEPGWRDREPVIEADTVSAACTIGTALIPHADAALRVVRDDPILAVVRRELAWLRAAGWPETFNLRDCYRDLNIAADDAHRAAAYLTVRSWVRPIGETTPKGGRPPAEFATHPRIADADTTDI